MRQEHVQDCGRHLRRLAAVLLAIALEEELGQGRNVLSPRPQRRQMDRHDVQAVVQVFSEVPGANFILERLVGGGNHARVHSNRPALAHALEFALLQHSQQLHLKLGAHAADFVEEDGAAVRRLEPAGLVVERPGERPLDVAEELAFEQALAEAPQLTRTYGPSPRGLRR